MTTEDPSRPSPSEAPAAEQAPAAAPQSNGAPKKPAPLKPCPYCGRLAENDGVQEQCAACKGWFEPLSRQASQNSMGPWFFHDEAVPFRPGCSYETLGKLIAKQRVTGDTLIRGPGSNQFWVFAKNCPGVAHLLGCCHNCAAPASPSDILCERCGASFPTFDDRQQLGLAPVRLLPGQANPSHVAASALNAPRSAFRADPDESNYGPVAPTFAIAAAEAASAHAEQSGLAGLAGRTHETIDESPEEAAAASLRRDRRVQRLRSAIVLLSICCVILLIAAGWMAIKIATSSSSGGTTATPQAQPIAEQAPASAPPRTEWSERLDRANTLIESAEPNQMAQGLAILRDIQAHAPEASKPAGLDDRIDQLAADLDTASLRNYLNKNN